MIVLQSTTPNDLHSFTATTRSLNPPNASIAVGPQPVQQSMYQTATYPAHTTTFVYSPATNSVTQQHQTYPSPRSSSSLPVRPSPSDNISLESAAYSLHSNTSSYRYDCGQMAGAQESRSPPLQQTQSSPTVISSEGVGQSYGATGDPRTSVGVSSSPQQATLGANMLPPLSEVLQQPPPPQQPQQQPPQQQNQQQPQVQNQQQQQVQNQQPQQQQQQPPPPQQQQQSQPHQPQSNSSTPTASPTQSHHASATSGSLMAPTAAATQPVTAGFYQQMGQYPDVSAAYASQDGAYAAQAPLIPQAQQQQAAMAMNQLGQQTSQLVTVVDPRLPPIAGQGGDLHAANLPTSLVDTSVRRLAISTANMAMNPTEAAPMSASSSTASPIMPPATSAINYQHALLNAPFMTATHPVSNVLMAPPRPLNGRRDMNDPSSMQAMVERPQQKVYSFVPLPGINTKKRPRRRYDEIERHYACNWPGCSKAYGTLNHLNAHVQMQKHGPKRHPSEFKELRKMWRRQKREEEERKAAEAAAVKQSGVPVINGIAGLHNV